MKITLSWRIGLFAVVLGSLVRAQVTQRVSVTSSGAQGNGSCRRISPISSGGSFIAFASGSTNLVAGDTNGVLDVFVRDRSLGATERVSVDSSGAQANAASQDPTISGDGRFVAFASSATNLVAADTNAVDDIFVRDRLASGFSSLCWPGNGGVIPCPCSNPPAGPGQGCENSSATGGAILSASGAAYLSNDTLVFHTSGQRPTAASLLVQGNALLGGGIAFGQGVRCASGQLHRLYLRNAVGGSLHLPDPALGDLSVSARSAALGDTILAGQSRWYFVYYRDPSVLGGCPASSGYNATQTGAVQWSP
jgi:hypothetical protein